MTALGRHLTRTVEERLETLFECRDFQNRGDPAEALHDLRVASRRLRAVVDVFHPIIIGAASERAGKPLRKITRGLRTLRDWDVKESLVVGRSRPVADDVELAAVEYLLESIGRKREKESRRAVRAMSRVDFDAVRDAVRAATGQAVHQLPESDRDVRRVAWTLLEPFVTALERATPNSDGVEHLEALHAFRIDAKRLRYGLELFEPILGDAYPALQRRVRRIQDALGAHHDLIVLERLLEATLLGLERRDRKTLHRAFVTLCGEVARDRAALFENFTRDGVTTPPSHQEILKALRVGGSLA